MKPCAVVPARLAAAATRALRSCGSRIVVVDMLGFRRQCVNVARKCYSVGTWVPACAGTTECWLLDSSLPDLHAGHADAQAVKRVVGGDVERAPVVVAERHVRAMVRDEESAEELSVRADDVDAGGAGAIDV